MKWWDLYENSKVKDDKIWEKNMIKKINVSVSDKLSVLFFVLRNALIWVGVRTLSCRVCMTGMPGYLPPPQITTDENPAPYLSPASCLVTYWLM